MNRPNDGELRILAFTSPWESIRKAAEELMKARKVVEAARFLDAMTGNDVATAVDLSGIRTALKDYDRD